ncbi:hypothetical protein P170DRAFT_440556 [Aspergillus steynii IBT 23096]|uniref:EthD domain-containing protein n=1 Tax=Aspergillus steynii IBT 23096 TaxID=1392250 RepID=A0A2I2FUB6_9EURO|nr:uncharacterized protein P170DRAFT_440556 [Aspergillus steynii IBT 23096]PLB44243.1 hypothetical protein P170DRAFT_440556 [Aspergillus steynii IBT 23096]
MVYRAVVMYPNEPDTTFDEAYYKEHHMALVEQIWGKYGIKGWSIQKYTNAMDGSPSKYLIACTLEWESAESLQNAVKDPETPKIFEDIPKFTNKQPITLAGDSI